MNNDKYDDNVSAVRDALLDSRGISSYQLQSVMSDILSHQVDYADIYFQQIRAESWYMENGIITDATFNTDQGFGLRAIENDETAFAFSQNIDLNDLRKAVRSVQTIAAQGNKLRIATERNTSPEIHYPAINPLAEHDSDYKVDFLHRIQKLIMTMEPRVTYVSAGLSLHYSVNYIYRHDFTAAADIRPMIQLSISIVVEEKGIKESASAGLGGRGGFEQFSDEYLIPALQQMIDRALINMRAVPSPAGSMPVVLSNGWSGMLIHEAMGHGFEGDFIRNNTSVYAGRVGEQVAAECINIVDDGTLLGKRGSLTVDDEGNPTQRTSLIENGVLKGYMHDSLSARLMNQKLTGNGRRQSYAHLPMPRMTNTFLLDGQHEPDEIISTVKKGLYLASLGAGQVDIVSGQYSFQTALAYLIEDGKITVPVKGATLTGNGPDTLRQISMVGNNLSLDPGNATCGKNGQQVPVCVGQPTLKVDQLLVGGASF